MGWASLCQAKAEAIRADALDDARAKSIAHGESALLFEESANHFRDAGQRGLTQISMAWRSFYRGWSAFFAGDTGVAEGEFRSALDIFQREGREDLVAACVACLRQAEWDLREILPS
jgi:hypothetical protein